MPKDLLELTTMVCIARVEQFCANFARCLQDGLFGITESLKLPEVILFCKDTIREINPHPELDFRAVLFLSPRENDKCQRRRQNIITV